MPVGVPEDEVFAAADRVLARGERPTVERVRAGVLWWSGDRAVQRQIVSLLRGKTQRNQQGARSTAEGHELVIPTSVSVVANALRLGRV